MGVDIGGFLINRPTGSQILNIAGAVDVLTIDTVGRTYYPNQIGFIAGYTTADGWTALPGPSLWNVQTFFNATTYNKGGGFSAGRFTAPIAGNYLFHWTGYQYKATAAVNTYSYPMFFINGAAQVSTYRLRGYPTPTGYSYDTEIVDMYYLNAGDYVDFAIYAQAAGHSLYRSYSQFSGFLVN